MSRFQNAIDAWLHFLRSPRNYSEPEQGSQLYPPLVSEYKRRAAAGEAPNVSPWTALGVKLAITSLTHTP